MRKQTSRIISMILSLAMLAAFVLAPLPVANAAATKTIYFDNSNTNWSSVYVYSWNGSGDCTGSWPGSAMTPVDGSIYSYEVPADAVNIIFTDNAGNQTSDLTIPTDSNNLYSGSGWSVYGAAVEYMSVYFDNSAKGWSSVYAYAWTDSTPAIGAWPGTAMTKVDGSIYSVEVPVGTASIIFNDNAGSQTSDLTIPTDGNNYFTADGTWDTYPPSDEPTVVDFYLVGFINGANYGCEEDYENMGEYKFVDGKLTATFTADSYVFVKTTGNAAWYMAESYCTTGSCFLYTSGTEKMFVPGNVELEFTLLQFGDGSLNLSYNEVSTDCTHDFVVTTTPATCTEEGADVYTCSKCGDQFTSILAATGHSYASKVTTAATCTEAGVMTYTCSACSDSYTEVIPATGHSYSDGKCTVCGTVDPNCDHSYSSEVTIAATCTETGIKTYTCSKCGDVYTEEIPANGHSMVDTVVPPTCENNGYTTHVCSVCGVSNPNTDAVSPIGHNYSSVVTAPTCTQKGYTTYTCANCGNVYTWNETAATGHTYVYGKCTTCGDVDATYEKAYYLFGFINGYNYGCEDDYANMGEYKFVDGKLTVTFETASYVGVKVTNNDAWYMAQAYCEDTTVTLYNTSTGAGEKLYVPGNTEVTFTLAENSDDTLTLSYTAEKIECSHSYSSEITTAAGCETEGVKTYTCANCGDSYTESIAATGHSYAEEITTAATCTADGVKTFTCSNCTAIYRESIPALGHNYVDGICANCGEAKPVVDYYLFGYINGANYACEEDYENLGQYKFVDGKTTAVFTETSYVGVKTGDNALWYMTEGWQGEVSSATLYESSKLFDSNKLYVPANVEVTFTLVENTDGTLTLSYTTASLECSHSYSAQITTAAGCETEGVKTYTCDLCGDSYTESIAATGHSYGYAITTEPTCSAYGVMTYTCIYCDDSYTETLDPYGHKYVDGYCSVCGSQDPDYVDPDTVPTETFYLVGYINGANYGCEEDYENMGQYKFVDGTLVATFETDSYVFLKTEGNTNWYMSMIYGNSTMCNFYNTSTGAGEKMFVPGGVELTFTLTAMDNDSYLLSYTTPSMVCPHTSHNLDGICDSCGAQLVHVYMDGVCSCGKLESTEPVIEYYLFGYINGANYGCEEDAANIGEYKFVDGQITVHFTEDSYIGIKTSDNANWYMTSGWEGEVTSARLYNTTKLGDANKLFIPGGVDVTITMDKYVADDSIGVSYTVASTEPSVAPTLTLKYPTVSFEDVIVMNVYYTAENLEDVVEMGLITYSSNVSEWNIDNAEGIVPGYTYASDKQMYMSSTNGIAAKNLGDTLYFAVYAKLADGTYTYTKLVSYSPETYAYAQLSSSSTAADVKALVVAMLKYGAAAQTFFGHNTDALVDRNLTAEQLALVEDYRSDMMNSVASPSTAKQGDFVANGGITRKYPTVSFEGAFEINYYCVPANTPANGVTMYYWNQTDYDAASVLTAENATGAIAMTGTGTYQAAVEGIAAKDLDKGIYVAFVYSDGTTTYSSGVLAYSIGTYCVTNVTNGADVADLAAATAVYGYYAKQTFYQAA